MGRSRRKSDQAIEIESVLNGPEPAEEVSNSSSERRRPKRKHYRTQDAKERYAKQVKHADNGLKGLTAKQEKFAVEVVHGLKSITEAYEATYNVGPETRPESMMTSATAVAHNPKVARRIRELRDERVTQYSHNPAELRDIATRNILELANNAEKEPVRLQANIALGKIAGVDLFKSPDMSNEDIKDITTLSNRIRARIDQLKDRQSDEGEIEPEDIDEYDD